MCYADNDQRHVQQGCDRPNYMRAKGTNDRPNQNHAVVDSSEISKQQINFIYAITLTSNDMYSTDTTIKLIWDSSAFQMS